MLCLFARSELAAKTNSTSVPKVWIKGNFIGGCNDGALVGHAHPSAFDPYASILHCMHACMHAFIHAYIHAYIPACMYTYLIIFDIFVCMHAADICRCIDLRPCKTTVYWKFYCCFSVSACGLNRLVAPIARRSSTMFNPTRDKNLTVHGVTWTNHDKSIQTPSN